MTPAVDALILTYHSISDGRPPLCIAPELFARQMTWLRANATVVPLTALAASVQGQTVPPRAVALTFDDGFADFYTSAAPILKRLDLPATVFLPAAYCGKTASWDALAGARPLMSWPQVRELALQGFRFGSHGIRHSALTGLNDAELAFEIAESRRLISAETGQDVPFFCYPYGAADQRTRRAVALHYGGGACTTCLRALSPGDDRYALPRVDVHYLRGQKIFRSMFTHRFRVYVCARRILRR